MGKKAIVRVAFLTVVLAGAIAGSITVAARSVTGTNRQPLT